MNLKCRSARGTYFCKEAIAMTRFGIFFAFVALFFVALGANLATANESAAAGEKGGASAAAPLLVAQAPEKREASKYDLQYKLSRGDVLRYVVTHQASISGTSDKTTQTAQSKTDSIKAWKVTDVLPNGDIEFMNVCERVRMVNELPDRKTTEYDSTRDKTAPPGFEDTAKAIGVPLSTMRITTHGKVLSRQIKVHNQGSNDDAPIVLRLPDDPVAIGDTWDEPFEVKVNLPKGASKSVKTRWHNKLVDVKDGIASIEVTYQILSPTDAGVELELVQRMMTGHVHFDIARGRIISQKMDVDKRIIGFAGPTSSMQYIMKMEEKLLNDEPTTAAKAPVNTKRKSSVANNRKPNQPTNTASKIPAPGKTYRR
jgi:hypothetical protein